jgi:DNA-binding response OmpR family regulator
MGSVAPSVLVVEDNIDTADSLARFLRVAAGFEVRVAYDGMSGVRMAVADPPDAVVCDLSLPRLHGLAVAERLTDQVFPTPLLIAVTGLGGIYPEGVARAAGFDHFLIKPADPFAIEQLISDHFGPGRR